jgi:hypothetical protein
MANQHRRVRKPLITRTESRTQQKDDPPLAHQATSVLALLNARWRVIDEPLQWILQRKKGNPRKKSSGWRGRSFCRTREALLRCVREYCSDVDPAALAKLKGLPDWHRDWKRVNLDARRKRRTKPNREQKAIATSASEDC